jgi:hypothetical protein
MVKTGPGKSEREIRGAIRSILRDKEQNFNALFRQVRERRILGSLSILSRHLKTMERCGEVLSIRQPGPGIPRKIYYLAEKLPAKYGAEITRRGNRSDLEEFWFKNPELAPVCITMGGAIRLGAESPEKGLSAFQSLYPHTGLISSMWGAILCYKETTGREPPKESIQELTRAYNDLWSIAVHAQAQEFKSAATEERKADYIAAIIKQLEKTHVIELPDIDDPWDFVLRRLRLPDDPKGLLVELKKVLEIPHEMLEEAERRHRTRQSRAKKVQGDAH